jgi:hypothetical protein
MAFELADVVPWGRSFDEYLAMFALSPADLKRRIVGCGDGPASFNALATQRGCPVISVDPIYRFSVDQLQSRIDQTTVVISEQARRNAHEFLWTRFRSVEELVAARQSAMQHFLEDFPEGRACGRYVDAALPDLPFPNGHFQLALCSHFLFLYSSQYSAQFHIEAIQEMARVGGEVRIFPLVEMGSRPSRHLPEVLDALARTGWQTELVRVDHEVQKGGNQMLRVVSGTDSGRASQ